MPRAPTPAAPQLPAGGLESPTTVSHAVVCRIPDKARWRSCFQQFYPLPFDFLNTADGGFAFLSGDYTVGITPGAPSVGYPVNAAPSKLAKAHANKLYRNTARVYGCIYGQSGGSVQMIGAIEGTRGVWDGIVPVVIATYGLNTHSFMRDALT